MQASKFKLITTLIVVTITTPVLFQQLRHQPADASGPAAEPAGAATAGAETVTEEPGRVQLSDHKEAASGIHVASAVKENFVETRVVPGRVRYDDTQHIAVTAATAGILKEVRVKPGDRVQPGQVLAVLSSPEVGLARAEVLQRRSELDLAQSDLSWATATSEGLRLLVELVNSSKPIAEIRSALQGKQLGKHRESILGSYSRYLLARSLHQNMSNGTGALSGRQIGERTNEFESAEASLQASLEQQMFDSRREVTLAQNALEVAKDRLAISEQQLSALLGYNEEMLANDSNRQLSLVEVKAPFEGTIERKLLSSAERLAVGDTLFILADTDQMWVAADLREAEWSAMSLHEGDPLEVSVPALGDQTLTAKVYFIGREVSIDTNSIPLVAAIDNSAGQLRPGLFVRVRVPVTPSRTVLAVPESAVCEHDSRTFVFVAAGHHTFEQRFIAHGPSERGRIEVTSGLTEGEPVVDQGAFVLKSELLLEREE